MLLLMMMMTLTTTTTVVIGDDPFNPERTLLMPEYHDTGTGCKWSSG